jgi:hypothetical protein
VRGLDFHKFYFDAAAAARDPAAPRSRSSVQNADVRLLSPRVALVAYDRIVQRPDGSSTTFGETRVWTVPAGSSRWRQVHFQRSPPQAAPAKA